MYKLGLITCSVWFALSGCNTSQEGARGNILFTPDECGRLDGCDFADSIGVGGVIHVNIQGIDGFSTAGVTLETADPMALEVVAIADVGGRPTWQVTAFEPGTARIVAYDSDDTAVDFLDVTIEELTGLILDPLVGDAVGPTSDESYGEIWSVNADQPTSFQVTPAVGGGVPTMGRYLYSWAIDPTLEASLVDGANLDTGYLYFDAPAADYEVSVWTVIDESTQLTALISAVGQ